MKGCAKTERKRLDGEHGRLAGMRFDDLLRHRSRKYSMLSNYAVLRDAERNTRDACAPEGGSCQSLPCGRRSSITRFARLSAEHGMLLLEVTLAVLIFSLAAVSFAVALNESLDAFHDIRRESGIRIQLQSALAEAIGQRLAVGKEKLQLGDGEVVYNKDVTLLELQNRDKQAITNLYQVVVTAEWREGQRKMQREAAQYVYQN